MTFAEDAWQGVSYIALVTFNYDAVW